MSDDSIPDVNNQHKPVVYRTGTFQFRILAPLSQVIDFTTDILRLLQPGWDAHNEREDMGRHLAESAGVDLVPTSSTPPRRRPPRKSGLYTVLQSAQEHGITHPTKGGYLQLPREFDAILALEHKAVTQVVLEVLRQTIGTPVQSSS